MERDERLQERIEGMQAEARERLGAPPSPEEILAYLEQRLAAPERLRVEEGVAAFPEAARLLRDLARFPDVRPDPGVAVPSEGQVDARWQEFRERRRAARRDGGTREGGPELPGGMPASGGEPVAGRPGTATTTHRSAFAQRRPATGADAERGRAGHWLRLAALVVVSAGLGLLAGLLLAPEGGRINLALASLTPEDEGATRGAETVLRVPESAEGVLLSLGYAGAARQAEYALTIRNAAGEEVWRRRGLTPAAGGSFLVALPADRLGPGRYRLELSAPGEAVPAAVYTLRIEVE